jgi:hypothetical protein
MKKYLQSSATAILLAIAATTSALAQNPPKTDVAKLEISSSTSKPATPASGDDMAVINSRAIKDFKKSFKLPAEEKWFKIETGFIVKFIQDGIQHRADYDNKGNWKATTRYYSEKQLPKDVRSQVKSVYYDYTITSVQELTFPDHHVYLVNMEDEKTILIIRICDGEMDVYKDLKKCEGPKN